MKITTTMKSFRQSKIIEIVQSENIDTQEDLVKRLMDFDIIATQATVSRDIKNLRLQKTLTNDGTYKYSLPGRSFDNDLDTRLLNIFKEGVISVDYAKNIVVLKTLPGLASAACSAVDAMKSDSILGTLAGDDTGFVVLKTDEDSVAFCAKLKTI